MIDRLAAFAPPAAPIKVAGPAKAATGDNNDTKLRHAASQLEGVFVQELFKAMRDTVPQREGIVSGGAGEEIFTGLLDEHLAAETPKQWESGIAEALYRQLRGVGGNTSGHANAASAHPPASPSASASASHAASHAASAASVGSAVPIASAASAATLLTSSTAALPAL